MARKKRSQKSASKASTEKRRQSPEKSVEDNVKEEEEDGLFQNNVEDSNVGDSPKTERSSTPIIHKKFGKVICPDDQESSNSHTTDSQTEENADSDMKSHDQQDELNYGSQIICEEIEVSTSEDVVMTEDGVSQSGLTTESQSALTTNSQSGLTTESQSLQSLYEIDERLKHVSVSSHPNSTVSHLISTSRSSSVDGAHSELASPSDSNGFEAGGGSNVQCAPADKLLAHRGRSGSTDTTSSESGSASSSSVRRSSRIKHTVQQRHREVVDSPVNSMNNNSGGGGASCGGTSASSSSSSSKSLLLVPPSPSSLDAVDKPVKVKSRWRRTSELEMVVAPRPYSFQPGDSSQPESPQTAPFSPCDTSNSSLGKPCPAVEEKLKTFERIDFNIYKTVRYTNKRAKEKMICDCFLTKEEWTRGEMGCGEDCLNRLLMIECCSRCNLKDRCSNKRFQNLEYAKCEMFKTEMKGFGLRALDDIPADTFLFEYVGEVVDTKEFHRRALGYSQDHNRHYYFMSLRPDAIIDATIKGNISRFINHSCDPNAETQKWTVDGELRIGFFSRKSIRRGEELTFDYQYQRYGKEAQKCYCGAGNCRGWIGENPDDEVSDEEEEEEEGEDEDDGEEVGDEEEEEEKEGDGARVERKLEEEGAEEKEWKVEKKKKKKEKRGRKKKRDVDYVVDDPDKDLATLSQRGIHNKMDTLAVLRCLVLAESAATRYEVLRLVRSAAAPCRRLLIDYHILKLLYAWMTLDDMSTTETVKHRIEILETLSKLPIPDKTKLKDSQVLQVVTDWSRTQDSEPEELKAVSKEAAKLLDQWSNLVDTFRIPKKERIEQMKEHEREADRGYRENRDSSYSRTWDRYRGDIRKDDRYKTEDRYKLDHRKDRKSSRDSPPDYKSRGPQLTKYEHRQLFALKVQAEDEERLKQEMEWTRHVERCKELGLDPGNVSGFDEMTGYPLFINHPPLGTMIPWYPPTPDMSVGGPSPIGFGPDGTPIFAPPPALFAPPPVPPMGLSLPPPLYPPGQGYHPHPPMLPPHPEEAPPPPPPPPPSTPPPIRLPKYWRTAADPEGRIYYYHCKLRLTQWEPPPYQPPLPPPPPPEDSSSSSSGGESSDSSEEEEEDEEEEEYDDEKFMRAVNKKTRKSHKSSCSVPDVSTIMSNGTAEVSGIDGVEEGGDLLLAPPPNEDAPTSTVLTPPSRKRKREGLVTEYIISPIQEFEKEKARERKQQIKDTKQKLKAAKKRKYMEAAAAMDLKQKKTSSGSGLSSRGHHRAKPEVSSTSKIESAAADSSEPVAAERQLKEQFRLGMAGVIVHYLNPYRKEDCVRGRILCNEDFKHLARKLTHFVLVKELKHCRSVGDLQCNENVKHKAKDFIRKYMSKFGEVYQREKEMD